MAVISQQLLPSPTTLPRARIFVDCQKMLKFQSGISPSHPRSRGFAVCPRGLQNEHCSSSWFWELSFLRAEFLLETTNLMCDFLAPTEQMITCLIITPRIHFATPGMSWAGGDLLKFWVVGRDFSPRDFICCEKKKMLWSHQPCGKIWWGFLCPWNEL